MDYKAELIAKIDKLLNSELTVEQFRSEYDSFYQVEIPDSSLTAEEDTFFGIVNDKLDFTHFSPDPESKKDGYMNYGEFVEWLKKQRENIP